VKPSPRTSKPSPSSVDRVSDERDRSIEQVLAAVLDGDLVAALHEVDHAGGPAAFGDHEALVEALFAERTLGLARTDAQEIARAIAADVTTTTATPEVGARAILRRLVEALGLTARLRSSRDPVVIDVGGEADRTLKARAAAHVAPHASIESAREAAQKTPAGRLPGRLPARRRAPWESDASDARPVRGGRGGERRDRVGDRLG